MKLLVLFCLFFALPASATSYQVSYGYAVGGGELNSTRGPIADVHGGTGFLFGLGAVLPFAQPRPHGFEAQISASFINSFEVGNLNWIRFPLELMSFYRNGRENFRAGYGVSYHIGNKLHGSEKWGPYSTAFDPALGWTVAAEKILGSGGSIGFKYTNIEYHIAGSSISTRGDQFLFYLATSNLTSSNLN